VKVAKPLASQGEQQAAEKVIPDGASYLFEKWQMLWVHELGMPYFKSTRFVTDTDKPMGMSEMNPGK
jgi:hypothetical protein